MNVVHRERRLFNSKQMRNHKKLVRKDASLGIRGVTSLLPMSSYLRVPNNGPRYQFNGDDENSLKRLMGPPAGLPRNVKRRIISHSTSNKPESSSSGKIHSRILASDSVVTANTSNDFCTPRNRPTALRYISSSSRGGYSNNRSARSTSTSVIEASVILAISEGRGMARGEIGIAAIDLRHPHLVLCQFSDSLLYTHTLTKINYFNPIEIIIPHTFSEGAQPNQLYKLIKDQFPLVNLTTVKRSHFNDASGRQNIQSLCAPQYKAVCLQVFQKFYALTAAAAILKYVEYIQCIVFAKESLKIEYHSSENTMVIDVATASQLELVQPLVPSAGPTCCLLGVLSPTYTIGGIRALRAAILQPSCNKDFIEARLDSIQDLIENDSGLMVDLQDVLKKLSDIDKILLLCVESSNQNVDKLGEAQLNQLLLLKTTMDIVPKLVEALTTAVSGKLRAIKKDFENTSYKEIADRIKQVIQEDAHLEKGAMGSLQRCFAVKPDMNGLLDVARRTYSELVEDIQKMVEHLREKYDLPVRLNQNVMKGFHIVLPISSKNRRYFCIEDLPPVFIQVQNSGAGVSMTTEELVVLDHQAKQSLIEVQKLSNIVISTLLKELRPFMFSLYKLCENIAEIDILLALAQASSIGSYIRPEFDSYLDIRNSVHPLLDYNCQVMPVPNDILASSEYNFTIITGPNMGGKSIYIKQIAIMQVMAQIGCFLPATNAVLRLCDRLFSRIGFNDSVELNASTFVLEMKEVQHMLKGLTSSSLIIIDELCRGTSSEEGASIAWAICEELILSDAFVFFTTHFMYLTRLEDLYHSVVNRHTAVTEETVENSDILQKRLVYHHKIEKGIISIEHYGLYLAEKTNLPPNTVKIAKELSAFIVKNKTPSKVAAPDQNEDRILYNLSANIELESRKAHSEERIIGIMSKFIKDNPLLIPGLSKQTNKTVISNIGYSNSLFYFHDMGKTDSNSTCIIEGSVTPPISNNNGHKLYNVCNTNLNYSSVKSTNELLHSVVHIEKNPENICEKSESNDNSTNIQFLSVKIPENNYNSINKSCNNSCNSQSIKIKHFDDCSMNGNNSNEEADDIVTSLSNNDLASVDTQMLREDSMFETNLSSQSSDHTLSIIEGFLTNAENEIKENSNTNENSLDNLVLTPPMEFRD